MSQADLYTIIDLSRNSTFFVQRSDLSSTSSQPLRTIWNIIYGSIVTIFACTWIAVHPNVPGPCESWFIRTRRRIMIFLVALLAPEFIVGWAASQYRTSRYLMKEMNTAYPDHQWTMTHSFFTAMGGFVLCSDAGDIHALDTDTLRELVFNGAIELPNIDVADIEDKSKGDGLAKALVLGQTGWFMVQVLARAALHLDITELEIMTVAYAMLCFCTYAFWWNKPQNVNRPIKIGRMNMRSRNLRTENILLPLVSINNNANGPCRLSAVREADGFYLITDNYHISAATTPQQPEAGSNSSILSVPLRKDHPFSIHTLRQQLDNIIAGFLFPGIYHGSGTKIRQQVPMFFSGRDDAKYIALLSDNKWKWTDLGPAFCEGAAGIIFGAIHATAWSFPYPSKTERIIWRICSLILIVQPLFLFFIVPVKMQMSANSRRWPSFGMRVLYMLSFYVLAPLYLIARLILLVQPFVLLRKLPPTAFQEVLWSNYFPHVR